MTVYNIGSGVTSGGITLNAGDVMTVLSGGTASAIVISLGSQETIDSGGLGTATQIRGGQAFVLAGGRVVGDVISSGVLNLAGTGSATTVGSGGTEVLGSGGLASATLVNSGGLEIVSGGTTSASVVKPGGLEIVVSGTTNSTNVSSGGVQLVLPRGVANLTIVAISGGKELSNGAALFNGTVLVSSSTVTLSGQTVGANETEYVLPHGSSDVAHVISGGIVNVYSGGTASGIVVSAASFERVSSGGVARATTISSGGQLGLFTGGVASSTVLSSGGTALVSSGGTVISTLVTAGATLFDVGMANVTTVNGGIAYIESGGQASATIVEGGGQENLIGGSASLTVVSPGGFQMVSSGSVANGTTVSSGGVQTVFNAGTANATVVTAGGTALISGGGAASGMVVSGGLFSAAQIVTAGGRADATTVRSGGVQYVSSGLANGTMVSSGGLELVHGGGVASATTLSASGGQIVSGSGLASNTVISGGFQTLTGGGSAIGTVIGDGGVEQVLSGGSADLSVVNSGGTIDLSALPFSAGAWADLSPSDVLTVIAGTSGYQQQLSGNYAGEFFQVGADSGTGSLVTLTPTSQTPPTRTLQWIGPQSAGFAVASDWNDLTEGFNPALIAPHSIDTAEFLSGGGTITGSGTVTTLAFGGSAVWQVPAGAILSATSGMTVGQTGVGALLINGGASVKVAPTSGQAGLSADISGISGEVATVTVDGAGTSFSLAGELIAGDLGAGDLSISNAATVTAAASGVLPAMALGANAGGTGSLLVFDTGSKAVFVGQLDVGQAGDGILQISNRGTVLTGNDAALDATEGLDVGQQASGSGQVTVTDKKSLLSNVGRFVVGDAAIGSMAILNDATVITTPGSAPGLAGAVIANTAAADGSSVSVDGSGSNWTVTGTLIVGDGGSGHMQMDGGATVTVGALDVAAAATGDGDVSLAGVGTTLTVTGSLTLGDQAAGELSVLGGAAMTIGGGVVGGANGAPGNLDIEDAGSQFTINGGTLVVGANGPAEFTLGIGATLKGQLATSQFGVTNLYGNVDPATDPNDGTQNVGFNNSLIYDFYVANSGTIKVISGSATYYTPLVTDETNAQDGSVNGLWMIGAKDTLVMNASSADNTQTFDLTSASGATLVIGQVPQNDPNTFDTFNGQMMPTLTGSIAPGAANVLSGWRAPIENYQAGDVIRLQGLTYGSATASGDVVTVWSQPGGQGSALGSLTFIDKSGGTTSVAALASATAAAAQINALACFAAGTKIRTANGWVAVEDLRVGDLVRTVEGGRASMADRRPRSLPPSSPSPDLFGGASADGVVSPLEPIIWIGSRAVNCRAHPTPETVWPVRIARGAFGDNVPSRDLFVSPDHAIYINGVLIPAKHLLNGTTVTQSKRDHVTYFHVELPEHAVILAEGLPVESYLDIGDRANFAGDVTIRLFPDLAARLTPAAALIWETDGAAPLVQTGDALLSARQAIAPTTEATRRERAV